MNIGVYGILVVFGLFIILLIFNPKLSCFGRKIKSPFYPLIRKRRQSQRRKQIPAKEFGLDLGGPNKPRQRMESPGSAAPSKTPPAEDYGFRLTDSPPPPSEETSGPKGSKSS